MARCSTWLCALCCLVSAGCSTTSVSMNGKTMEVLPVGQPQFRRRSASFAINPEEATEILNRYDKEHQPNKHLRWLGPVAIIGREYLFSVLHKQFYPLTGYYFNVDTRVILWREDPRSLWYTPLFGWSIR